MTAKQRIHLMSWWAAVCRTQGWNPSDRAFRLQVLGRIVKRPLTSANDLNTKEDIDAVFAEFGNWTDHVGRTVETDHPELGDRRRLLWKYQHVQRPCLSVYIDDVDAYVREILRERFKVFEGISTVEDLSPEPRLVWIKGGRQIEKPSPLMMLVMTLDARINKLRSKAGDSIHDMKLKADLDCDCAKCEMRCPECGRTQPGHSITCKTGNARAAAYQSSLAENEPF